MNIGEIDGLSLDDFLSHGETFNVKMEKLMSKN